MLRVVLYGLLFIEIFGVLGYKLSSIKTDPSISHYVKKYQIIYNVSNLQMRTLTFSFVPDDTGRAGWCHVGIRHVTLNARYWNTLNDKERTLLLFHEITHCLYGKGHDDRRMDDNCPLSLMHSVGIVGLCAEKHFYSYIQKHKEELR